MHDIRLVKLEERKSAHLILIAATGSNFVFFYKIVSFFSLILPLNWLGA